MTSEKVWSFIFSLWSCKSASHSPNQSIFFLTSLGFYDLGIDVLSFFEGSDGYQEECEYFEVGL